MTKSFIFLFFYVGVILNVVAQHENTSVRFSDVNDCDEIGHFAKTVLDSSLFFKGNVSEISDLIVKKDSHQDCAYFPHVLSIVGFEAFISNNILESRKLLLKADSIYSSFPDINHKYYIRNKIFLGLNYSVADDTIKSMQYLREAEKLSEVTNNIALLADAKHNIAGAYKMQGYIEDAELNSREAIQLAKESGNLEIEAFANLILCEIHKTKHQWSLALENIDIAKDIFQRLDEPRNLYLVELRKGEIYLKMGDTKNALKSLLVSETLGNTSNHFFQHGVIYKHIGDSYKNSGEINKSLEYYESAMKYSSALSENEYSEVVYILSNHYKEAGNVNKLEHLISELMKSKVENIEESKIELVETQKIEAQIEKELNAKKLLQIQNKNIRNRFIILSIATLICVLLGLYAFRESLKNKRLNDKITLKNEELHSRNIELKNFTSIASHDLKAPVRSILGFVQILEKKIPSESDEKIFDYLNIIKTSSAGMNNLVNSLLEFSTLESRKIKMQDIPISKMLDDVLTSLHSLIESKKAKVVFSNDLPDAIKGDETLLRVVFQNLINNAIKFTAPDVLPLVNIEYEQSNSTHIFKIIDNGIGIEKKYLDKVFLMFQRLNSSSQYEGSGIGLATCKKIILLHRGDISIESTINKGSTFIISIPQ